MAQGRPYAVDGFDAVVHEIRRLRGPQVRLPVQRQQVTAAPLHDLIDGHQSASLRIQQATAAHDALPDAGAGRQDDEIRFLKPAQQPVQPGEAGGDAEHFALMAVQVLDAVDHIAHDLAYRRQIAAHPAFGDTEDELLGPIDHLVHVLGFLVGQGGDLAGGTDQAAQGGGALDNASIIFDMDRGGHTVDQGRDIGQPAYLLELVSTL